MTRHRGRMLRTTLIGLGLGAAALSLSACTAADQVGSPSHRISTWVSSTGFGQTAGTLEADARSVAGVIALHHGTAAIHTACGVLETDSATAESNLPTPDEQLTHDIDRAATLDYKGAVDCYDGGGTNQSLMRRSARERAEAAAALAAAIHRVEQVTNETLSTTTTTQPGGGGLMT